MTSVRPQIVSIITPCLNAEEYIKECMMSVRSQSYRNVEHIIVDGQSTDNTISILRKHETAYNMRWISGKDRNPADAINKGMRMASGDILSMLGADDFLMPWTVDAVIQKFNRNPLADFVYGDFVQVPFGATFGSIYFGPTETALRTHLRFNSIGAPTVFFTRRAFEALNGFDENLAANDYDFWLRAVQKFKFSKVDEALGCFRYRKESLSMGNSASRTEQRAQVRARFFESRREPYGDEMKYYAQRVFSIIKWLFTILAEMSETDVRNRPWNNLVRSRCLSRARLISEILLAPVLTTNNRVQTRVRHGYVDVQKLIRNLVEKSMSRSESR